MNEDDTVAAAASTPGSAAAPPGKPKRYAVRTRDRAFTGRCGPVEIVGGSGETDCAGEAAHCADRFRHEVTDRQTGDVRNRLPAEA